MAQCLFLYSMRGGDLSIFCGTVSGETRYQRPNAPGIYWDIAKKAGNMSSEMPERRNNRGTVVEQLCYLIKSLLFL